MTETQLFMLNQLLTDLVIGTLGTLGLLCAVKLLGKGRTWL